MIKFLCGLIRHRWGYSEGTSKGFMWEPGEPRRTMCWKRTCKWCGKRQEMSHWSTMFQREDGEFFTLDPIWIDEYSTED